MPRIKAHIAVVIASLIASSSFAAMTNPALNSLENTIANGQNASVITAPVVNDSQFKYHKLAKQLGISYQDLTSIIGDSQQKIATMSAAPATTLGAPSGFGASAGQVYIGVGGISSRPNNASSSDGVIATGIGFGNADKYLGVELNASITALSKNKNARFGDDGLVGLKLHRNLPWQTGIAIGTNRVAAWGDTSYNERSYYASVSKIFDLHPYSSNKLPLTLTLGAGNGIFRNISDQNNNKETVSPFGAISLDINSQLGFVFDYTADLSSIGISTVPIKSWPVTLTVAAFDLGQKSVDRFTVVAALSYSYKF